MIRTATRDELPAIRDLLIRANDAPYDIGVVAEEKCFGDGLSGATRVRVFGDYEGVAVTCGRYLRIIAVDRDSRGRGIGSALLEDSRASVIAAEPGNYFTPGVIDPAFFVKRGFREKGTTFNLGVRWQSDRRSTRTKAAARPPHSEMLSFVEHHFGRAWRFEAQRARIAHYIPNIGFAVAEANNRGLGTFGPIGVAKQHRGKGYSRELLRACLADLEFERVIIPWTNAIDFYRKACGAEPAHRFVLLEKGYSSRA